MRSAELSGPVAYAPGWLWLGLGLALLAAAWPVALWWLTRPRRSRPVAPRTLAATRAEAHAEIARVHRAHAAGELTGRGAHQELSRVVRAFVADGSGWPVDHMGLADLRTATRRDPRLADLTEWVAGLQPPSFAPEGTGDVAAAADRADALVERWAAAPPEASSPQVPRPAATPREVAR